MFRHTDGTYIFAKEIAKAKFSPVQKKESEKFTDFLDREIASADIICNGPLYSTTSTMSYYAGSLIDPKDVNSNGFVYINGQLVDGRTSRAGFYINYNGQYQFGEGDPPAPQNAIGGLGPLIIRQYRPSANFPRPVIFNDVNVYDKNVEKTPPPVTSGNPEPEHEDNLLRRSNNTIVAYNSVQSQGIMAIGSSSISGFIYVVIREAGKSSENEILSAVEHFQHLQCDNAVFLDGSSSVTCRTKKRYYARPDRRKDNSIEIGFKIYG